MNSKGEIKVPVLIALGLVVLLIVWIARTPIMIGVGVGIVLLLALAMLMSTKTPNTVANKVKSVGITVGTFVSVLVILGVCGFILWFYAVSRQ